MVVFSGRKYLAFRTSPFHMPGRHSKIVVLSKKDKQPWHFEKEFNFSNFDCRDPKLVVYGKKLYLFFSLAKANKYHFAPMGVMRCQLDKLDWTEPKQIYPKNYFLSQIRIISNQLYLCLYVKNNTGPVKYIVQIDKQFRQNKLSSVFEKLNEEGTESDLYPLPKKRYLLIIRLDQSNYSHHGSKIIVLDSEGKVLKKEIDRRKFDSPLIFQYRRKYLLLSRQQLSLNGYYGWGEKHVPKIAKNLLYQVTYWLTKKSTAIWSINLKSLKITKILNLPSQGDTGYCSAVVQNNMLEVYNYSTVLNTPQKSWRKSQSLPSVIYQYKVK